MPISKTPTRPAPGGTGEGVASDGGRSSLHETSDAYARILAASGRWRVVRCRDDLQFIVQKRAGRAGLRPWQGVAYVLSPMALGPVLERPSLGIPARDRARLLAGLAGRGIPAASDGGRSDG